jgi:hypothetical protein
MNFLIILEVNQGKYWNKQLLHYAQVTKYKIISCFYGHKQE